jgi:hypothetical protein
MTTPSRPRIQFFESGAGKTASPETSSMNSFEKIPAIRGCKTRRLGR